MNVHPDKTAKRAVDACGGAHPEAVSDYDRGVVTGYNEALGDAMDAVADADDLTAELLKALDELQDVFAREDENTVERFDRLAAMFDRDTGYMAPGKSRPMHRCDQPDGPELHRIYDAWFAAKVARARAAIAKATGETGQ